MLCNGGEIMLRMMVIIMVVLQCGGAAAVCESIMRQCSSEAAEEMFLFHAAHPYPCRCSADLLMLIAAFTVSLPIDTNPSNLDG